MERLEVSGLRHCYQAHKPATSPTRDIGFIILSPSTYDHRLERTGHPVRSAIHKLQIGGLVVGSVTTSEYPLLYVFFFA
jgi:hypothetical protein